MSNTVGALVWINAVTPNYIKISYSLSCTHSSKKIFKTVSIKNIIDEVVKSTNFIKSWPLSTCAFDILCDKTGNMHKALLHTKIWWLFRGKASVWLSYELNYLFSSWTPFSLKRQTIFILGYLAFSQKWTKWTCHLKGNKQLRVFVANDTIWAFNQ